MKPARLKFYKKIESRGMLGLICAIAMDDYLKNGMTVPKLKELVIKNLMENNHEDKLDDVMKIFDDKIFEDAIKVFGYTSFIYVDNQMSNEKSFRKPKKPYNPKRTAKKPYRNTSGYNKPKGNKWDHQQPKTNASRFEIDRERYFDNSGAKKKFTVVRHAK